MNVRLFELISFILVIGSGSYGFFLHRNKIFPYKILKNLYHKLIAQSSSNYGWAIGIYAGSSPFDSLDLINIKKPALTARDVTDIEAQSLADPFIIESGSSLFMFFEAIRKSDDRGVIGLAESWDGVDWKYKQIVIEEPFHLSYPYIFKWQDDYYLVPESNLDLSVRIYRATDFPTHWKYEGKLLSGYHFTDPSIIRYNDTWWMFVSTRENDVLNLYYSDTLMGAWMQHPLSPIVRDDRHKSRPAGRLLVFDGKLYRLAQDDYPIYGSQVFAYEIIEISRTTYREKLAFDGPIVKASQRGWNSDRMHHLDALMVNPRRWLVAVDGYRGPKAMSKYHDQRGRK
jgi:hypothetical protein